MVGISWDEVGAGTFPDNFPVGCLHRVLKKGNYAQRIGAGAPVYLWYVLLLNYGSLS